MQINNLKLCVPGEDEFSGLRPGAVVITTPWVRSGSSNIFEAQTSSLADAGLEVALLVGPAEYWHSDYDSQLLADI